MEDYRISPLWSPTALQPWPLPQRFVGHNPPTRRPRSMGGVAKENTLIHPRPRGQGILRFAEEGKPNSYVLTESREVSNYSRVLRFFR